MNESAVNTTVPPSDASESPARSQRIVFFDDMCGMCSCTIDFLLRRNANSTLLFAPLQGSTAQAVIPADVRHKLDTMVYARDGELFRRSTAIVRILRDLGGLWNFLSWLLWLIPAPLRDVGYRTVSALRYRLFGKHDACRVPTPEEREWFLD